MSILVIVNVYGKRDRKYDGVYSAGDDWVGNIARLEILRSYEYFVDEISPTIFNDLKIRARKYFNEQNETTNTKAGPITIHQVVLLS